jgi:CHAD domain-containing protein
VSDVLWSLRARSVAKARKALLRNEPEGLHDLRVALRRAEATAAALGKGRIERRTRKLVRSLSPLRQLEVDRGLLARIRQIGRISESVAASLDAQWDPDYAAGMDRAARVARGGRMRRLERKLRRLSRTAREDSVARLELARQRVEQRLVPPPEDAGDRRLHRFRIAVKRARYLAEDLAACGVTGLENRVAHERQLQDALGRWNDIHLFRERLKEVRSNAEERGAVSLAGELDPVIAALEGAATSARREALAIAGRFARVIPFLERSA